MFVQLCVGLKVSYRNLSFFATKTQKPRQDQSTRKLFHTSFNLEACEYSSASELLPYLQPSNLVGNKEISIHR